MAKISSATVRLAIVILSKILPSHCEEDEPDYENDQIEDEYSTPSYLHGYTTPSTASYYTTHRPKGNLDVILGIGAKAPPWPPAKSSSIDNLLETLQKLWEKKQETRKGFAFVFCSHMCPAGTVCQGTRCVYPKPPIIPDLSSFTEDKELNPYSIDSKTKKSKLKEIMTKKLVEVMTHDLLWKRGSKRSKSRRRSRKKKLGSKQKANRKDLQTKNV